ncbi:Fyv7 protein [Saccharomycopsis crataegensis]|uniref:rRNA-processing protein FYV7 n=1 Tax=Saccharomycopsis crataegensis TaxID=43959 RepID=A0AAV5QDR9_9ASCO|nr:Fyv7 protein [Saccharomycopsis crataegensis]
MSGRVRKGQYYNPRDKKRKEIEKSLVHKSNLRKKYFKLLEKEGQKVPEKKTKAERNNEVKNDAVEDEYDSEADKDFEEEKEESKYRKSRYEPTRQLTYEERSELIKQRRTAKREEAMENIRTQRKIIAQKNQDREKKKRSFNKKTKKGQPSFAPRINNLLDKIKKDVAEN